MNLLLQFALILLVSFLGEIIKGLVALPIPASIYGLALMMLALSLKIIKLKQVEKAADWLLSIMPVMFIPAAVALLGVWHLLRASLWQFAVITVATTVIVMGVTAVATQAIAKREERRK